MSDPFKTETEFFLWVIALLCLIAGILLYPMGNPLLSLVAVGLAVLCAFSGLVSRMNAPRCVQVLLQDKEKLYTTWVLIDKHGTPSAPVEERLRMLRPVAKSPKTQKMLKSPYFRHVDGGYMILGEFYSLNEES